MQTNLKGKVALVTGAAQGIGRATALGLAREGTALALFDHDARALAEVKAEILALDVRAETFQVDLRDGAAIDRSVSQALAAFGGQLDILVNNVGAGAVRLFDELSDEEWDATFNLNFMSYVRMCRSVLPVLRKQGHGVIINNASDLARQPEACPIDYSASKAAVLALTKGLARAEGPNIRINAVAPGPIWTPFWTKPGGFAETLGRVHNMPPQQAVAHEMSLRQLPLARLGTPEEVANVIVFLASDLASFVTSSVWGVDGGSVRSIL